MKTNSPIFRTYKALRRFHNARDAHNIASRIPTLADKLNRHIGAHPDKNYCLQTARVDYR